MVENPQTPDVGEVKRPDTTNMAPEIGAFKRPGMLPETKQALDSFLGPADPLAVGSPGKTPAPVDEVAALEQAVDAIAQAPEMTYEARVKACGTTLEEAHEIVDTLMRLGTYEKTYRLTKKVSVTFRTRPFTTHEETNKEVEDTVPQFMGTHSTIIARHNLKASLVKYGDAAPNDDFVARLPHPVFNLLVSKLAKFDEMVFTVFSEGAIENF